MKDKNMQIRDDKKEDNAFLLNILDGLKNLLGINRAMKMPDIYTQISYALEDAWLIDIYIDNGQYYAILAERGKLYRAAVLLDTNANTASLALRSFWQEVMEEHVPVRQSLQMRAQEDGTTRWFLIAGTTIVNRNGEIDSSALFDKMIARCEETNKYPFLTFFHLNEDFSMGHCDYLARDGVVLIASGLFHKNNKIADAMIRAYEAEPNYWGSSIGFYPLEFEMVYITQEIELPVYQDGIFREISILPEEHACALMTALRAVKERNIMDERKKRALEKLANGDENLIKEFESMVDDVNRTVVDENLIHRETPETPAEEVPAEEIPAEEIPAEEIPVVQEKELVLDELMLQVIAERAILSEAFQAGLAQITTFVDDMTARMNAVAKEISDLHSALISVEKSMKSQFETISRSDEEKRREWEQDLSERTINKIRVTYRPTQTNDDAKAETNLADIARSTISNLK